MKKRLLAAVGGIALILSPAAAMAVDTYSAQLSGADEVPPRATDAFGTIVVSHFPGLGRARFTLDVRRATAILSAVGGHIHCAPAGANGPIVVFLAGEASPGGFDGRLSISGMIDDDNVIPGSACGDTLAELLTAAAAGNAYVNLHSTTFPGGEIRGQLMLEAP